MNFLKGLLLKKLSNLDILQKMMLMYVIGGLIPLLLVSFFLTRTMGERSINHALKEATTSTIRVEERLEEALEVASAVSDRLYLDKDLHKIIKTDYKATMDVINDLNNYSRMDEYLNLYEELEYIRIYVKNDSLLDNAQIINVVPTDENGDWYQIAYEMGGRMTLSYKYDEFIRGNRLSIVRLVKDQFGHDLGVLVVAISDNYLKGILEQEAYATTVSINQEQHIAMNSKMATLIPDTPEYEGLITKIIKGERGIYNLQYLEDKYKLIRENLGNEALDSLMSVTTLLPLEELMAEANASYMTSLLLIVISIVVSFVMFYGQSRTYSNRLRKLKIGMHKVAVGEFEDLPQITGEDEIGSLANDLKVMTDSLKALINDVYVVELQKKNMTGKQQEAQFKMLASQINPHFLYNALETIRMKAHIRGEKDIAVIVRKLAEIMRRNLSVSSTDVTIQSEIDLIIAYLEIQQFRFGDKITFAINTDDNLSDVMILPLLLQPIVENAFIHGLEEKLENGHIDISFKDEGSHLCVFIEDNGMGIHDEKLAFIRGELADGVEKIGNSIGLANVQQRLQLYYGEDYGLDISSQLGQGTKVTMRLPMNRSISHV